MRVAPLRRAGRLRVRRHRERRGGGTRPALRLLLLAATEGRVGHHVGPTRRLRPVVVHLVVRVVVERVEVVAFIAHTRRRSIVARSLFFFRVVRVAAARSCALLVVVLLLPLARVARLGADRRRAVELVARAELERDHRDRNEPAVDGGGGAGPRRGGVLRGWWWWPPRRALPDRMLRPRHRRHWHGVPVGRRRGRLGLTPKVVAHRAATTTTHARTHAPQEDYVSAPPPAAAAAASGSGSGCCCCRGCGCRGFAARCDKG